MSSLLSQKTASASNKNCCCFLSWIEVFLIPVFLMNTLPPPFTLKIEAASKTNRFRALSDILVIIVTFCFQRLLHLHFYQKHQMRVILIVVMTCLYFHFLMLPISSDNSLTTAFIKTNVMKDKPFSIPYILPFVHVSIIF